MSKEAKRVAFTTIGQTTSSSLSAPVELSAGPSSTAAAFSRFGNDFLGDDNAINMPGKSGSGASNGKTSVSNRTFRLQLELFESDSHKYPEFNYSKQMYLEKKKVKKLKQASSSSVTNGFLDPFVENDDDVMKIAKELEKKYGTAYDSGRGRGKKDDFCDIGMGYDESDSFIDNTDAYDEVVPEEVQTLEGGFYINCGALKFANLNKKSGTTRTDEIIKMPDRPKKRALSTSSEDSSSTSSEDDDEEDDDDDEESDSETESEDDNIDCSTPTKNKLKNGDKHPKSTKQSAITAKNNINKSSKKAKLLTSASGSSSNSPRPNTTETNSDNDERARLKVVKTTTVKDMLKAKRDSFLKSQEVSGEGIPKSVNGEVKCTSSDAGSNTDTSEECIVDQENLNDKKPKKVNANSDISEKMRTTDTKLPNLDIDIVASISSFKELTKSRNLTGKKFLFDQNLTDLLLKIDEALLCIDKNERNMVFAHMEFQLQLPKYFFLRKAKQLRIKEEKNKTNRTLSKLRKAVIEIMPKCIATYEAELCKYADMQANIVNAEHPPKMPRKKFPWNNEIRNLLYDVYQVRWTSYAVLGTRKDSLEDFINGYMKEKVVELWPNGWMRYEELQKEIEKRKTAAKKAKEKMRKEPKLVTLPPITIPCATATNLSIVAETTPNITFLKNVEDFAGGSSRSHANSDTDSVASASSNSLKCRTPDAASSKKNKSKVQKQNFQILDTVNPMASTSAQAAAAMSMQQAVSVSGALDLVSPAKKTDHSIYNIMTTALTAPAPTSLTPTQLSTKAVTSHSNMSNRLMAHVINLDDYNSANDILQTSKQLASTPVVGIPRSMLGMSTNILKLDSSKIPRGRESGSESDGVEIVGVYPAKPIFQTQSQMQKQKNNKKGDRTGFGIPLGVTPNVGSGFSIEQLLPLSGNSVVDVETNARVMMALKDYERLQKQQNQAQFSVPTANIKGAPANQ